MIVIRVVVKVKPEEKQNFVQYLQQEMREVKDLPGCERFALHADVATENAFLLYEEWSSMEQFDAYRHSDSFKKNGEKLFAMMAEPPDSAYFTAQPIAL